MRNFGRANEGCFLQTCPLNKKEALEMIKEVKGYPLLTGFRGSKPADIDSLSTAIIKLSKILIEIEDIKEIEINPLFVYEKGVRAVDARVVLCIS